MLKPLTFTRAADGSPDASDVIVVSDDDASGSGGDGECQLGSPQPRKGAEVDKILDISADKARLHVKYKGTRRARFRPLGSLQRVV